MAEYKQGDFLELVIDSYGMDGEGIAHDENGFTFFVPYALKSEKVKVRVTYVKRQLIFTILLNVIEPSSERIKPECNRFPRCGGCDLLHMQYKTQLEIKKQNIENLFKKNVMLNIKIEDVEPSELELGYRNKIQLPFGTVNNKVAVGFYEKNSHKIASITKCFLHGEWVEPFIKCALEYANNNNLTVYNDITKKGLLRHLVIRKVDNGYTVVLVTNRELPPNINKFEQLIEREIGSTFALYVSIKQKQDNVILGESMIEIRKYDLYANILGLKMEVNPFSFLQLNNEIRDKIYNYVISSILKAKKDNLLVIDAYAGIGAIGAKLAQNKIKVVNIEIVKEATQDADRFKIINNLDNDLIQNINGDAAIEIPKVIDSNQDKQIIIILDPPRKGCDRNVLESIKKIKTDYKIYYISCNPATLTRDIQILKENNDSLEIEFVKPYDMFPQTSHVETIVSLTLKNQK
ncbi:MAG: 23S rRNA (uracil(1939)-C(5))-methyltransferase RlmD [Clostridia bacterium]|nr:23S rRNA (uracil(1939)-C(5))-methyltransferase RlmD [Clostridia bacterium]